MSKDEAIKWISEHNRQRDIAYPGSRWCRYFRTMWRIHYGQIWENGRGANGTCEFATPDETEAREAHTILKANPDPFYYVRDPIEPSADYVCSWCPTMEKKSCPPGVRDPRNIADKMIDVIFPRNFMGKP